uniref:RNase H type-1 domain-containing protein n=1 Tax=Cannabis sativa TaxID=3483 RepID=A0A803NY29_CANSA
MDKINDTSASTSNRKWWNRLWALKLPKKVKIFAWRVINDALPTAVNLMHRKILPNAACSLCNCHRESLGHAIFLCTRAKQVWSIAKVHMATAIPNIYQLNGFDIFSSLAAVHTNTELERILCIMWSIWTERNKEIHGTKPKSTSIICSFADHYVNQYINSTLQPQGFDSNGLPHPQPTGAKSISTTQTEPIKWTHPPAGCLKLNVDAAFDEDGSVIGVGAVVRDYFGDVVGAFSKSLPGCYSPKEMEAMGLIHSLQWILSNQMHIDYIETDSLIVANAINKHPSVGQVSLFYDLIDDISLLLSSFPRVSISHVKRDANKAAHGLARFALRLDNTCSWLGEIPSPIHTVIVMDSIQ